MESIFTKKSDILSLTKQKNYPVLVQSRIEIKQNDADEFYTEKRFNLNDFGIEIPRFSTIFKQICGGDSQND
jgi:hypothetical protein